MHFTVVLPNSVVIEISVDPRENGQQCLEQVCTHLGILEQDYFGLQFTTTRNEKIWLNMRNRIDHQRSGMKYPRFHLRVKYYVQPHLVLQESSRHLFYLQVKQEILSKTLQVSDQSKLVKILALIAQEEFGDQVSAGYETFIEKLCNGADPDFVRSVVKSHAELHNLSSQNAQYRMLQEASSLEDYGMEKHEAKNEQRKLITVGVGPEGVFIYDLDMELEERIEYPMIQKVVHDGCDCTMFIYTDEMTVRQLVVRLRSLKAASALYRCITEMHSFFRCDTVNSAVSSQVYHDFKGLFASLFNENSKNYVFDVQHTWREVYDSTRRKLMEEASDQNSSPNEEEHMEVTDINGLQKSHDCPDVQKYKTRLEKIQESFLCRVCMDSEISTVLCPCGHMTCCQSCANRLEECPLCRTEIQKIQTIFLPTPLLQKS